MLISLIVARISTGQILNRNYQIDDNNLPVQGMEPDLIALVPYIPYPIPDYDSRYYTLIINEPDAATIQANQFPSHPIYTNMPQFLITYDTERRANDEIFISVDNAMKNANISVMPPEQQLECISLSQAALIKRVEGMTITSAEQESINNLIEKCVKLRHNFDYAVQLKLLIEQGGTPDIDTGWQREE